MLRIEPVSKINEAALVELFSSIGEDRFFHPHPLTELEAHLIATAITKDVYLLVGIGDPSIQMAFAYGMLRGWQEGWEVPSLGIVVAPQQRGLGIGRMLMEVLHTCARLRNAPAIRLKVYADNEKAKKLYKSLGYQFVGVESDGQELYKLML